MDQNDSVLSRRFARALFEISEKHGDTQKVKNRLFHCISLLRKSPKLGKLFYHPQIDDEKKMKLFSLPSERSSTLVRRLALLLLKKKRFHLLHQIGAYFERIVEDSAGTWRAAVRSAFPLSQEEKRTIEEGLSRFSRRQVQADMQVDPELLGGIWIRMGDWVIDRSLKGQLQRLRKEMA